MFLQCESLKVKPILRGLTEVFADINKMMLLELDSLSCPTNNTDKKTFRRPTNDKYKKSITYQGPKLWNSLPGNLKKIDSYHEFKSQVNRFFKNISNPNCSQEQNGESRKQSTQKSKIKPPLPNPNQN